MKPHSYPRPTFMQRARLWTAMAALGGLTAFAQTIPNPSFEADAFTTSPGYISGNTAITGWTGAPEARVGLNPAGGSPFADNGAIPEGQNVAFIQSNAEDPATPSALSTTITGLTVGNTYKVTFRANARSGQAANLRVTVADTEILTLTIYSAGGSNPYWYVAFEFTAAATTQTLALMNDTAGDQTVLVDDFKIAASAGKVSLASWNWDEDSGVDAQYFYTHAYNFGSSASPIINGVTFTGIPGGAPAVVNQFSTTYLGNVVNGDANNVSGNGMAMATDFCYGGTIPVGSYQSITLQGLTPGTEYVATLFTVGWESPGPTVRWATFSVGEERLTLNQDLWFNDGGLTISCRYTADASGGATLKLIPINPNNMSIHVYGFGNREAVSRNVAPVITGQPQSITVAEGLPVTFTVTANGIPAPSYQWRFKGNPLPDATGNSYALLSADPSNAGDYDVVVANSVGSVTSSKAILTVGLPMTNPSFEVDAFLVAPGYVSGNGPITAWTALGGHGINPANGSPFADNGIIPHGVQVAFMQENGALSQTVSGFTPNAEYYVHYYENARNGGTPFMELKVAGTTALAAHGIAQAGSAPYHEMFSDVFVASAVDLEVAFVKSNPLGGDTTALIDNVAVVRVPAGTAAFVSDPPDARLASVGDSVTFAVQGVGSLPLRYQWLKNGAEIAGETGPRLVMNLVQKGDEADYSARVINDFGSATSAPAHLTVYEPIPDLFNTGVDSKRALLADSAVDPHYQLISNPDTGSTDAIAQDTSTLPGAWMANNTVGRWIGPRPNTVASAIGLYTYRTTIDLTDRDPSTLVIEGLWATDNTGRDIRVNGVSTGNPQNTAQFAGWTPFSIYGTKTAFVAGPNTIDFVVDNEAAIGYTGLRVQIVRSNLKIPPGTKPEILTQPLSQKVPEGATVTLTATARGTAPLSYQWSKDGVALDGQTSLTLTLNNVTPADSGAYTITVSNAVGSTTSAAADVCVCWRPIPGVFGTGLNASGGLLGDGEVDPHYILAASDDPAFPGPDAVAVNNAWPIAPAGPWLAKGPNSTWIAPQADQSGAVGNAPGAYTYQTSFDLTGYTISQVVLLGGWAVDNGGTDILVNGQSTGLAVAGFGGMVSFTIASGLVAGPNTLDFIVSNAGEANNPAGLRVDLKAYLDTTPAVKPTLTITKAGAGLTVGWSPTAAGQKLLSAPALTGPWTEVVGAANPYSIAEPTGTRYYRVSAE